MYKRGAPPKLRPRLRRQDGIHRLIPYDHDDDISLESENNDPCTTRVQWFWNKIIYYFKCLFNTPVFTR
jgi:hypothetical protein